MAMGLLLVDVNGLKPLTLRTSSVACTPLQLLKRRIYVGKEQYGIAENKTVAYELHTKKRSKVFAASGSWNRNASQNASQNIE